MSTHILLIRHGETQWNKSERFRGTYDIPLNENGKAQANVLSQALKDRNISVACTSPLSRAVETAQISLADRNVQILVNDKLTDIDYGDWTGLTKMEVMKRWPKEYDAWTSHPDLAEIPGGEKLSDLFDRCCEFINEISKQYKGQTVAIFAHRVINKLLILGTMGLTLSKFLSIIQDNCCINELEFTEGGYIMRTLNDISHMKNAKIDFLGQDF